jgi:aspartate/methionine/tyrosine aminotransferase
VRDAGLPHERDAIAQRSSSVPWFQLSVADQRAMLGDFADRLLEEAWVSVVPGMDFGDHAPRTHLRLAYTTGMDSLQEAASRIKRWLGR